MQKIPTRAWPTRSRSRKSGSRARRAEHPRLGQHLGDLTRAIGIRLDDTHPHRLRHEHASDCEPVLPAAEDDHVVERPLARARIRLQAWAASGEPMITTRSTGKDRLLATRDDHPLAADDAGHLRVAWDPCLAEGPPTTSSSTASAGTSNSTIWTWPSAKTSVWRAAGMPIEARDRVRGLELGRDHEVDVDLPLVPGLEVLDVGGADDRRALESRLASIAETRLISSRDVHASRRSAVADPGLAGGPAARAVAATARDVVAVLERLDARRRGRSTVSSCSAWRASTTARRPAPLRGR